MRNRYRIAGLTVDLDIRFPKGRLARQAFPYRYDTQDSADFQVQVSDKLMEEEQLKNPHLSPESLEYILTGIEFFFQILRYDGIGVHASAVVLDGASYLFSAASGTGKSTHTQLWCREFGPERAFILNDDKPILRLIDQFWYACGTPWSGKTNLNIPKLVPIRGIAFLEQGTENRITRIRPEDAVYPFLEQTILSYEKAVLEVILDRTLAFLTAIPAYRLQCRPDPESVHTAYQMMKGA